MQITSMSCTALPVLSIASLIACLLMLDSMMISHVKRGISKKANTQHQLVFNPSKNRGTAVDIAAACKITAVM